MSVQPAAELMPGNCTGAPNACLLPQSAQGAEYESGEQRRVAAGIAAVGHAEPMTTCLDGGTAGGEHHAEVAAYHAEVAAHLTTSPWR